MGGWFRDTYVLYIYKSIRRFFRERHSGSWPTVQGLVARSNSSSGVFGCPTAEVIYTYELDGHTWGGRNERPFISPSSAESYAARFSQGRSLIVRSKPKMPNISVVIDKDQLGP
jgi:hypothetical protein